MEPAESRTLHQGSSCPPVSALIHDVLQPGTVFNSLRPPTRQRSGHRLETRNLEMTEHSENAYKEVCDHDMQMQPRRNSQ
jgi:hypothetical protein